MTNNTKYNGGPKSKETKAISSRNSITHGLTARRWLDANEQVLFDETVEAFNSDFDPQTSIEKVLISKIAECSVRLIRIQQVENAMFDLASSEAEHPAEVIRSLDNDSSHPILIEAMQVALHGNPTFNPKVIVEKTNLMDEIDFQNLSDVSGWGYVEKHMPMTKDYIIDKCLKEGLDLYSFIFRETDNSANLNKDVEFINKYGPSNNKLQSKVGVTQDSNKIQSTSLQQYLEQLSRNLGSDIQAQMTLNNVEKRSHQIKGAAIPDIQKLGLIQRYRTADERLFSKSLGELIALQDRRKASN